ncbi:MAG: phosphate signaling complex protein PhoU [Eubacteriales bacterium]|nr:phosphate signaling complex protein PhoU [Eubacteriales bacterium]
MRSEFEGQLKQLHEQLENMGGLCQEAMDWAVRALTEGDKTLAAKVPPLDARIDQLERDIEALCLKLLLKQQPVARDLRQVSAALKMITDMERIGDQCREIAEIIPFLAGCDRSGCQQVADMGRAAIAMVNGGVNAFIRGDLALARQVIAMDDGVDNYFSQIKADLIGRIAAHPEAGECALDLLMIAKYFERIGDHASNIAEWVDFSLTGDLPPEDGE